LFCHFHIVLRILGLSMFEACERTCRNYFIACASDSILLLPDTWAKFCGQRMCMFVCLSERSHMSTFHEFSIHVTCGCGLIFLWRQCNALCTSSFMDDVMFYIMKRMSQNQRHVWSSSPRGGFGAKSSVSNCISFAGFVPMLWCHKHIIQILHLYLSVFENVKKISRTS